jgi:hypothetical protein
MRAVLPYLETESLAIIPPQTDCFALLTIYKRIYEPILPIVDMDMLISPRVNESTITSLKQAMCLVVCKCPAAKQHLRLKGDGNGELLSSDVFADKLLGALKINLDVGLVQNKTALVQILLMMTFHARVSPSMNSGVSTKLG